MLRIFFIAYREKAYIHVYIIVYGDCMTEVISIRIPKELKERMKRHKNINWNELIRRFIEETVARYEAEEIIKKIEEDLRNVPELPSGTVSRWLRIDRESH